MAFTGFVIAMASNGYGKGDFVGKRANEKILTVELGYWVSPVLDLFLR